MVDSSYGAGPPNSNIVKCQQSGVTGSVNFGANLSGLVVASGTVSQSGGYFSGISIGQQPPVYSGVYTCNMPTSESSWNV